MTNKYILDGKTVVPTDDLLAWGRWLEAADRRVDQTVIDGFRVSTVFMGLDHRFGEGEPLLFETMVFRVGSGADLWAERCSTWEQAEAMHERGCDYVRSGEAAKQQEEPT